MPRALAFTLLALVAFAANSLLARAAIGPAADGTTAIGPVAFTALRLAAGAVVLWPWWRPRRGGGRGLAPPAAGVTLHAATPARRIAAGATALVAYALPFSLAYVALGAATGALLLFGAVQLTMIGAGLRAGERLGALRVAGLVAALAGLVVLLAPGLSAPPPLAAATMLLSGVAWGAYSLIGRDEARPIAATARNFAWSLPAAVALAAWPGAWAGASTAGVGLALTSGALTSGLGYVAWYLALPSLSRTVAATVQLSVPLVAALGALALLGEAIDLRFSLASALVLGGIAAVVLTRR
ncbi:MAG: DMT family transporter [Trueperaceae bacterium]|nr:DMT family transporter [Trueperaceae bacterium]